MKLKALFILISSCVLQNLSSQQLTQIIRGHVIDAQATYSLPGANIVLVGSDPVLGTITNPEGYFRLENVPMGRHDILVSYLGYNSKVIPNILVNSAKEVYLEIMLEETIHTIDEAVVVSLQRKEKALNEMAMISSRSFTVDEATRYAGNLNDPARMAANFAGVSTTGDMRNDIIVRGNSPNGILYRLEGVNIPNPNHLGTTGASGGYYSMLSQNMLSNSDFLTGAFPAQYGNALSGIFDINYRKGNNEKREYAFTFGLNGIEFTTEGPFSSKSKASYLINYRYSTLGAFDLLGIDLGAPVVPKYQDLSFKIHHPLKSGYIKVFGLTGTANIHLKDSEVEDPKDFFSIDQPSDIYSKTAMAIAGLSHKYFFNKNSFGELTLSISKSGEIYSIDTLAAPDYKDPTLYRGGEFNETTYSLLYDYSTKINSKNKIVAGVQTDFLDLQFDEQKEFSDLNETQFNGTSNQFSAYVQWLYRINKNLSYTLGTHGRYFELTKSTSIEPRTSLRYAITPKQSLNVGVGLHSQGLPYYAYFIEGTREDGLTYNKYGNVSPSKSQHYILGYNYQVTTNLRIKLDGYYQHLYGIPVEITPSYWSAINVGGDFEGFPDDLDELVNQGTGENLGVELTVEKFLSKGYYYLFTASLFNSMYKGSDGIERNSAFNSNYVFNLLAGKEFAIGKQKQNTIAIDFRANLMGGRRYIPIDYERSEAQNTIVYDYSNAYKDKYADYFRADLKISYNINRSKLTHQFILDLQNITNHQNLYKENYSISNGSFAYEYQLGFMPNIQYRVMF